MTRAWYNENDPHCAAWLRQLIQAGVIAEGDVDERSIEDVYPADLAGYAQCHFFAGIGGWSLALRLAGWDDDRPVWTGSCPCQPFSQAGRQQGHADRRDWWPEWRWLIAKSRPAVVVGEQVGGPGGRWWLDRLATDLERDGYRVGAADLPAAGVGAWHRRERLWFVADTAGERYDGAGAARWAAVDATGLRATVVLADADAARRGTGRPGEAGAGRDPAWQQPAGFCAAGVIGAVADAGSEQRQRRPGERRSPRTDAAERHEESPHDQRGGAVDRLGDADLTRLQGSPRGRDGADQPSAGQRGVADPADAGGLADADRQRQPLQRLHLQPGESRSPLPETAGRRQAGGLEYAERDGSRRDHRAVPGAQAESSSRGEVAGHLADRPQSPSHVDWADVEWLACRDGKRRPTQPGLQPLAHGLPPGLGRSRRLRGYGNAIVPQVGALFVAAYLDTLP